MSFRGRPLLGVALASPTHLAPSGSILRVSWGAVTGTTRPDRTVAFKSTDLAIQAPILVQEDLRADRLVALAETPVATKDHRGLLHEMSLRTAAAGPAAAREAARS